MDTLNVISSTTSEILLNDLSNKFKWPEYLVFGLVLALSAAIGMFYGCVGSKNRTNEEFLMGNRRMAPLPVSLSLLCSFLSAVTLLGFPAEIYLYGIQDSLLILGLIPLTFALTYLYVPVFFKLQLTSAYEYLEIRFNRSVRITISVLSILYLLSYMSIVVYAPALALRQVTGIHHRINVAAIFVICIFYSTLGGVKSVVATDSLQCVIMILATVTVVVKGVVDVGGLSKIWETASESGRIEFFNFDPDPRTRYTVWSSVIGETITYLTLYAATQANIQRFVSIATISKVRRALIYNMIGLTLLVSFSFFAGLVIFAKYSKCDPVTTGQVSSSDQLLPLFVMDILGDYPGLPGFFVAGITCASLSSVSSGLNALAAIITEDYIRHYRPKTSDRALAQFAQITCLVCGIISYGITFGAELTANILPIANSLIGAMLGPTLGVFSLGMFWPWANAKGSLLGVLASFAIVITIALGSVIRSDYLPNQKLPLSTEDCSAGLQRFNQSILTNHRMAQTDWKHQEFGFGDQLFSISFVWMPTLGSFLSFTLGLLFSLLFKTKDYSVDVNCISPPFLAIWRKLFPKPLQRVLKTDTAIDHKQ